MIMQGDCELFLDPDICASWPMRELICTFSPTYERREGCWLAEKLGECFRVWDEPITSSVLTEHVLPLPLSSLQDLSDIAYSEIAGRGFRLATT
jgi:hypothetical protein